MASVKNWKLHCICHNLAKGVKELEAGAEFFGKKMIFTCTIKQHFLHEFYLICKLCKSSGSCINLYPHIYIIAPYIVMHATKFGHVHPHLHCTCTCTMYSDFAYRPRLHSFICMLPGLIFQRGRGQE